VATWVGAGLPRDRQAGVALVQDVARGRSASGVPAGRSHGGGDAEGRIRSG
jgi:hypothetical protein